MAVGPVTLSGVIQRTQDIGMIKQQEESKPLVEQHNIQAQLKTQEHRQLKQVQHAEDAKNQEERYDAKEKGNNEYHGQQKKKRKQEQKENIVVRKQGSTHFDMKI
ncbi:MAG: hypothetical protein J6A75_07300 [Lachnospiraceae bacterium]|nr:hypothetical protein [Lachnospiraceae bacterium]